MGLNEIREKINNVDRKLVMLLNRRMSLALKASKFKNGIEDPAREKEVLENAENASRGLITREFSEKLFTEIIAESKRLQAQKNMLVGFQGEHGAYSEAALKLYNNKAIPIPCRSFAEVFEMIQNGQLDAGFVPVENSIEGSVTEVNDLLVESNLWIAGEMLMPIHHCLLCLPDADHHEINTVYSHPQALGQCKGFIERNKLHPRPFYDTAGSAMMLAKKRLKYTAVIASKLAAEIYGLEVFKENIEDHESNATRFIFLTKERSEAEGDKCTIAFSTEHKAGSLFSMLKIFSEAQINLTRIESRPARKEPLKFVFLVDFQGQEKDKKIADAMKKIEVQGKMFRFLGCYKEAKK